MGYLHRIARIPTSGARAVEPCEIRGEHYLVIPQLAVDIDGAPAGLDGGDSDSARVVVVRVDDDVRIVDTLPVPGGEDAEFFTVGERHFLAVANVRSGRGPYDLAQPQRIYEWSAVGLKLEFTVPGYAAKQWRHVPIADRHFVALAQGVTVGGAHQSSVIYEWTGGALKAFQEVPSAWGYNWHHFTMDGTHYLAYADHVAPSVLLRWDGRGFEFVQDLIDSGGRAFASFSSDGEHYLLAARLNGASQLLRWNGDRFVVHQELAAPGAREFAVIRSGHDLFVVRVNFTYPGQQNPSVALKSQIYQWGSGQLNVVEEFPTTGATDVASWRRGNDVFVAVSNGLSAEMRFAAHTDIYRFSEEPE